MAQVSYRANITAPTFPFLSQHQGKSIIIKQSDQYYMPSAVVKQDADRDLGIPQLYYGHNILPTGQGISSVGYTTITQPVNNVEFLRRFLLRDSQGNKAYLGVTKSGTLYVCFDPYYTWTQIGFASSQVPSITGKLITLAHVNGTSYIYIANSGCFKFNFSTRLLEQVTLTGLDPTLIIGIVAASGYMIAWGKETVSWSSSITELDFTPSLETGAGGGKVQNAKGDIALLLPHAAGFIAYTTNNAVACTYTGNARYPFKFSEIIASGGLADTSLATFDANTGNQYAYTTSGMQLVALQNATTTMPELTDFIAGSVFEDFDETLLSFVTTHLTTTMKKKLSLVSDRYLVISYGVTELTHAIVYDLALNKYGKLKVTHVECFEFSVLTPEVTETPKASFAFLCPDGAIKLVKFSSGSGVALFGKYQYIRQRTIQLQTVSVESVKSTDNFNCYALFTSEGKTPRKTVKGYLQTLSEQLREFKFCDVGHNISLLFVGAFSMNSLELNFNVHGKR